MADLRCPKCASKEIRGRLKSQEYVCRRCLHVWARVVQTGTLAKMGVHVADTGSDRAGKG